MGLETGTYINDLNVANPVHLTDDLNAGDDHLRLIKTTLKNSFPSQVFPVAFVTGGGAANVYTGSVSTPTALGAYINGMEIKMTIPVENTGASTFNLNSLGAKAIKNPDGSALVEKQLLLNSIAHLIFSTTLDAFLLIGGGGQVAVASNPGECYFEYTSTTVCTLVRDRGSRVMVKSGGIWQARIIPAAGITLSNSGLIALTVYNVYLYDNSGTLTLEASVTGHSPDADTGVEIKTGDATRTLVGKIKVNTGVVFTSDANTNYVISWYNRRPRKLVGALSVNATVSWAPFAWTGGSDLVETVLWGKDQIEIEGKISAAANAAPGTAGIYSGIGVNSASVNSAQLAGLSYHNVDGAYFEHASSHYSSVTPLAEGAHTFYLLTGKAGTLSMIANAGYTGVALSSYG